MCTARTHTPWACGVRLDVGVWGSLSWTLRIVDCGLCACSSGFGARFSAGWQGVCASSGRRWNPLLVCAGLRGFVRLVRAHLLLPPVYLVGLVVCAAEPGRCTFGGRAAGYCADECGGGGWAPPPPGTPDSCFVMRLLADESGARHLSLRTCWSTCKCCPGEQVCWSGGGQQLAQQALVLLLRAAQGRCSRAGGRLAHLGAAERLLGVSHQRQQARLRVQE